MQVQGDENIAEKHFNNTPASINTRKNVSHNVWTVPKALAYKASNSKHNGTNNQRLRITLYGSFPSFVIALRAYGFLVL